MTYKEARVYLDKVSKYGSVLGLDTIRGLLCELGNPQKDLQFIHIAGTNGKGSVLAYTSTILSEAGYKTGRYVSPTVVSYLERIQIDGQWIPENEFAILVEEVQQAIARMEARGEGSPTVFEAETAIAFLYFKKKKCDLVVLETGLGGALDATNIVENTKVAVFTSISRDHMGFLGNTLEEITTTKAGILKTGCVAVSVRQKPEVAGILQQKAKETGCSLRFMNYENVRVLQESWQGSTFSFDTYEGIRISLAGKYQLRNAVATIGVIEALQKQGYEISEEALRQGFAKTVWMGRFTCIEKEPLFLIDGAHNKDAAERLRESIQTYFPEKKLVLIMGVFKDKEYEAIAELMAPLASRIYTVELPDTERTLSAEQLKQAVAPFCGQVQAVQHVEEAVRLAFEEAEETDVILAFGSLSYLGQVMESVKKVREKA